MPEDPGSPEEKGRQRPLGWRVLKGVSLWLFRLALLFFYGNLITIVLREGGNVLGPAIASGIILAISLMIAGFKSRWSFDWILVLLLLVELGLVQGSISLEWASAPLPIVWVRVLVVQAALFLVFLVSSSIYRAVKKRFHYSLFATELMVLASYVVMLEPLGILLG